VKRPTHPKKDRRMARDVGEMLRLVRELAGLTQAQAAARVGIARTSIVKIERGINAPCVDTFMAICAVYGISPGAILDRIARRGARGKKT
jgi:transcriptional regulator with XRE-family HTH domain